MSSPVELFALFRSDPEAVPTFNGVAVVQDVPAADHELIVNGAGLEPYSVTVSVAEDGGVTPTGVEGEVPLVARERAVKMAIDPSDADSDLNRLAVEDDFAGRLYDASLSGPDAVYVHEGGAYTTEVRDTDDAVGAFRINPQNQDRVRVSDPRTGKASLAEYLADVAAETRDEVAAVGSGDSDDDDGNRGSGGGGRENAVIGLANALEAVADAARRAADAAAAGDRGQADRNLDTVVERLERVSTRLAEAQGSLPDDVARAAGKRLDQANRRGEQARTADKL